MDTEAGTIRVSTRPAGFTVWAVAVSVLAAVALIMSAVAITMASRDRAASGGIETAARIGVPSWDPAKLEAMEGRMAAVSARIEALAPTWDADKLEAMAGLMEASRP